MQAGTQMLHFSLPLLFLDISMRTAASTWIAILNGERGGGGGNEVVNRDYITEEKSNNLPRAVN
mgnify:CR=1 FL=1